MTTPEASSLIVVPALSGDAFEDLALTAFVGAAARGVAFMAQQHDARFRPGHWTITVDATAAGGVLPPAVMALPDRQVQKVHIADLVTGPSGTNLAAIHHHGLYLALMLAFPGEAVPEAEAWLATLTEAVPIEMPALPPGYQNNDPLGRCLPPTPRTLH